jgi:excisionase family DNA binding protein
MSSCGACATRWARKPRPPRASLAAPNGERPNALLDAAAAAELLAVPKSWVLAEARADRIPHVRLGKYVRFEAAELEAWWQSRRRGPWRSAGAAAASARTGSGPVRDGHHGA